MQDSASEASHIKPYAEGNMTDAPPARAYIAKEKTDDDGPR